MKAGSEKHCLVETVGEKCALKVSQAVEQLDGPLTVADVEDLFDFRDLFDFSYVGSVVVQAHLCPGEVPITAGVILCAQRLVSLRILSATIVTDPDIVASFSELQMERRSFVGVGLAHDCREVLRIVCPARSIHSGSVLAEN